MDRVSARVYKDWIKSADRGQMQTEFLKLIDDVVAVRNSRHAPERPPS
jgi:hypothetical protein